MIHQNWTKLMYKSFEKKYQEREFQRRIVSSIMLSSTLSVRVCLPSRKAHQNWNPLTRAGEVFCMDCGWRSDRWTQIICCSIIPFITPFTGWAKNVCACIALFGYCCSLLAVLQTHNMIAPARIDVPNFQSVCTYVDILALGIRKFLTSVQLES